MDKALYPRNHLQRTEGFDEIGVGAAAFGILAIGLLAMRRNHSNRYVFGFRVGLDGVEHLQAINLPRHHHIQKHSSRVVFADGLKGCGPVIRFNNFVLRAQADTEQAADIDIVVDDKNMFHDEVPSPETGRPSARSTSPLTHRSW